MSSDPKLPPSGVDPSEDPVTASSGNKDKDKDKGGGQDKGKDGPAASKGINPVQHSE